MKETILMVLDSLARRLNAANQITDPAIAEFAKRLARNESRIALRRIL